jgi:hypothetical protein
VTGSYCVLRETMDPKGHPRLVRAFLYLSTQYLSITIACVRFDTLTTSRAVQGLLWSLISNPHLYLSYVSVSVTYPWGLVGADLRVAPPVDTGTPVSTRIFACPDLLTD